jgi:transcriptional regulator with GAF, ATPase, and Fis domain
MRQKNKIDKLDFFSQATYLTALIVDDIKAVSDLFQYLRGVMPLHALSWHFYDRTMPSLRMEGLITSKGLFGLENRMVRLTKASARRANMVDTQHFVHLSHANEDPLGRIIIDAISDHIGKKDMSLQLIYLEWKGAPMGHLCLFCKKPDQWPPEHQELFRLLSPPFSFAIYHMRRLMELTKLKDRVTEEKEMLAQELRRITDHELIGADSGLREIMVSIEQLAFVDTPVLIVGETGVGKELVSNAIQKASPRRNGPYVKVNCGAIPDTLLDSELFGHEKGAFTGAIRQRKGRFELADGGTIFLDEIGELPMQAQVRLLRILQNNELNRVGGTKRIKVDIRFIAATHRDLLDMVRKGLFREDLFFRINVFPIVVPPLRHRLQDIPDLVDYLLVKKTREMKLHRVPQLEPKATQILLNHRWPGNVRELENLVERALILNPKGPVNFKSLLNSAQSEDHKMIQNQADVFLSLEEVNRNHIEHALILSKGKINGPGGAAERLQIRPNTLRRRMDKLGIHYGRKQRKTYR